MISVSLILAMIAGLEIGRRPVNITATDCLESSSGVVLLFNKFEVIWQ